MTDNIKGRVTLRVGESTSAGAVLALVQRLKAAADLVSMTPNPDDSIEITVDTPHEVATFVEQLRGLSRLCQSMRTYAESARTR